MNYVGRLLSNFKGFYNEINSATLTGAIDVVVVRQEDGSYTSSPFHVRFGKMGVLRSREKMVEIEINGQAVDLKMKLGEAGEAFFVEATEEEETLPAHLATSPIVNYGDLMEQGLKDLKAEKDDLQCSDTVPKIIQASSLARSSSSDSGKPSTSFEDPGLPPTIIHIEGFAKDDAEVSQSSLSVTDVEFGSQSQAEPVTQVTVNIEPPIDQNMIPRVEVASPGTSMATQTEVTGTSGTPPHVINEDLCPLVERVPSEGRRKKRVRRKKNRSVERGAERSPVRMNSGQQTPSNTVFRPSPKRAVPLNPKDAPDGTDDLDEEMFDLEMSDEENDGITVMSMTHTVSMPLMSDSKHAMTEDWCLSHSASAFHPFSDTDITPIMSPVASRPPSPKSDTEVEAQKSNVMSQTLVTAGDPGQDDVKWRWGELPEKSPDNKNADELANNTHTNTSGEIANSGLFQFMRKTKKIRHQPQKEGIYLDDLNLNEMDPEVAQLYLYNHKSSSQTRVARDEDNESGRGASLPHSPVSLDADHHRESIFGNKSDQSYPEIAMSLCGGLKDSVDIPTEKFLQHLVTYDDFCRNPTVMHDPNLVIRIDDKFYNWQIAGPIIMSVIVFQQPISEDAMDSLVKQYMPKKEIRRRGWIWWRTSYETSQTDVKKTQPSSVPSSTPSSPQKDDKHKKRLEEELSSEDEHEEGPTLLHPNIKSPTRERFRKTLKLTSSELESLGLKPGRNEVEFTVTTAYQGTARCQAFIYLWNWDDHIIVSDIDGTVTRSDVLGQVLPMIGKDWSQAGIAKLYKKIGDNGYKFLYLSARAIGQSRVTRDYLRSIRQCDIGLPDGPLLLSPSSLISAFHREVIERKPEEFKISCLRDISACFPPTRNPFVAGYGNKINDVWAYRAVGIPMSRIFTVNHRGELHMEQMKNYATSYTSLSGVVDHFFPPLLDYFSSEGELEGSMEKVASGNFTAPEDYSSFTYWRNPLPEINLEVVEVNSIVASDKS